MQCPGLTHLYLTSSVRQTKGSILLPSTGYQIQGGYRKAHKAAGWRPASRKVSSFIFSACKREIPKQVVHSVNGSVSSVQASALKANGDIVWAERSEPETKSIVRARPHHHAAQAPTICPPSLGRIRGSWLLPPSRQLPAQRRLSGASARCFWSSYESSFPTLNGSYMLSHSAPLEDVYPSEAFSGIRIAGLPRISPDFPQLNKCSCERALLPALFLTDEAVVQTCRSQSNNMSL